MTDDQLADGLKARDSAALCALVETYAGPVYALVHRILAGAGAEQDVEEVSSDVFHAAWQRAGQFDPARAPLRTWLLMIAKYAALERRRSLLRPGAQAMTVPGAGAPSPSGPAGLRGGLTGEPADPDPAVLPDQALAHQEERAELQQALSRLAPIDRQLVYRHYYLDAKVADVAQALGLSRQAADNRLWRARKALREMLSFGRKGEVAAHEAR